MSISNIIARCVPSTFELQFDWACSAVFHVLCEQPLARAGSISSRNIAFSLNVMFAWLITFSVSCSPLWARHENKQLSDSLAQRDLQHTHTHRPPPRLARSIHEGDSMWFGAGMPTHRSVIPFSTNILQALLIIQVKIATMKLMTNRKRPWKSSNAI